MVDVAIVPEASGVGYLVVASLCAMADSVVLCSVFFRIVLPLRRLFSSYLLFFSTPQLVEVVMQTDVFFLCRVVSCLFRMSTLSSILVCRVDLFAFLGPSAVYFLPDFFVRRRRLVVVVDFRRTVLLVEVLVGLVVATVVFVADDVLVAEVDSVVDRLVDEVPPVVPEAVVDVVAEEVAVPDPW
jgi:hypothetical protein